MFQKLRCSAVALLLTFASAAAGQEQLAVSPAQVRALSLNLLTEGRPEEALRVTQLLFQRDPQDVEALLIASQAANALGDAQAAARYAQRAYWAAPTGPGSFTAARLAANALAAQRKDSRAQLYLRLARQAAPNEAASEAIARDYQSLRQRNPWSNAFQFGITPSSNINGGTNKEEGELFIPGLGVLPGASFSGEAQALSGLQLFGGFSSTYRLAASNTAATFVGVDGFLRSYVLSNEAKEQSPDSQGRDFSDAALGVSLTHNAVLAEGWLPTTATYRLGQTWYAQEPFTRSFDVSLGQQLRLSERDGLTFRLNAQDRLWLDDNDRARSLTATVSWVHVRGNRDSFSLSLSHQRSRSDDDVNDDFTDQRIGASYNFAEPVAGFQFGVSTSYSERHFEQSSFAPAGRDDDTVTFDLRVRATEIEVFGFQPVFTVSARQTRSNVDRFDQDTYRFGFDLQSSF